MPVAPMGEAVHLLILLRKLLVLEMLCPIAVSS